MDTEYLFPGWSMPDADVAASEGWNLYRRPGDERVVIMSDTEGVTSALSGPQSNSDAFVWVKIRANGGSDLHQRALRLALTSDDDERAAQAVHGG